MPKGAEIVLGEHAGDASEHSSDLLASRYQLRHGQLFRIFRLRGARRRNLAGHYLLYITLVLIDVDEFVFATREESAKVIQEFSRCSRLDEELQRQFVQAASQVDEQVEIIDYFEAALRIFQQPERIGMEGRGAKSNVSAQFRRYPGPSSSAAFSL